MSSLLNRGVLLALVTAILFGAGTVAAKWIVGAVSPWLLAGVLYLYLRKAAESVRTGDRMPKTASQVLFDRLVRTWILPAAQERQTKDPTFAAFLEKQAVRPSGMLPGEFAAFIKTDRARANSFLNMSAQPMKEYMPSEK